MGMIRRSILPAFMAAEGLGRTELARLMGAPKSTVDNWLSTKRVRDKEFIRFKQNSPWEAKLITLIRDRQPQLLVVEVPMLQKGGDGGALVCLDGQFDLRIFPDCVRRMFHMERDFFIGRSEEEARPVTEDVICQLRPSRIGGQ